MKDLFIVLAFLSVFSVTSKAQNFSLGDKWIFDYRLYNSSGSYTEKIDSIEIVADTIINGLNYFMLVASEEDACGVYRSLEFLRFKNKQVYRLSKNFLDEELMIDYTDQVFYNMNYESDFNNEIIETTVFNDSIGIETLSNGDKIEVIYQRIINNSSTNDNAVYKLSEDLGYFDFNILFPSIGTGLCDVNESTSLRCKISGSDTLRLTDLGCYESSIRTSNFDLVEELPLVYPNPTSGLVQFSRDFDLIEVQNLSGRTMKHAGGLPNIDLSDLPDGVYILVMKDRVKGRRHFVKVIKRG